MAVIYSEVGADVLERAVMASVRENRFMPTICELRERAGLNQKTTEDAEAQQAWLVVLEWIRRYGGPYRQYVGRHPETRELMYEKPPQLPDRIMHAARMAGGIPAIEETPESDLHYRRDDFIEAYKLFVHIQEHPLRLPAELAHLLPTAPGPKQLPAMRQVRDALVSVEQATAAEEEALKPAARQ